MVRNIAHRGFSGRYPENTMLAFNRAIQAGCDAIELDVHLSKDGKVVIIHDERLDRTTSGGGFVRDYTLKQLQRLDAYGKFRGKFERQSIPSLREYFTLVSQFPLLTNIELKNSVYYYPWLEEKVIELVREFKLEDRVIFSSFNNASIMKCRGLAPEVFAGFLCEKPLDNPGEYARCFGVQYVHPNFARLKRRQIKDCKQNGIGINAWTINSESEMKKAIKLGLDGIITNHPDVLSRLLHE